MLVGEVEVGSLTTPSISWVLDHELCTSTTRNVEEDAHATYNLICIIQLTLVARRHVLNPHDLCTSAHRRGTSVLRVAAVKETADAEGRARGRSHDAQELTHGNPTDQRLEEIVPQDVVLDVTPSPVVVHLDCGNAHRIQVSGEAVVALVGS